MSGAMIFRLALMVLVFIAWAWLLFRTLAQASEHEKGMGAGVTQWLRDPGAKRDRSTLAFLSFVLAAMIGLLVLLPAG